MFIATDFFFIVTAYFFLSNIILDLFALHSFTALLMQTSPLCDKGLILILLCYLFIPSVKNHLLKLEAKVGQH